MDADLHIHTTASDGSYTPAEVVEKAKELGLKAIAITDHDTIDGILPAQQMGRELGIEVLAGIELNTDYNGVEIHVLGYLFDPNNPEFRATLAKLKTARDARVKQIVEKLQKLGVKIDLEQVNNIAGSGVVGRPHVARALLVNGYVQTIKEAFERFIGTGCPAYVSRFKITPQEGVKIIRDGGGIPILAHPGLYNQDQLIEELVEAGLRGIEVYHSDHQYSQSQRYLETAKRLGLLITGGSDCHGPLFKARVMMGTCGVEYTQVERLKELKAQLDGGEMGEHGAG